MLAVGQDAANARKVFRIVLSLSLWLSWTVDFMDQVTTTTSTVGGDDGYDNKKGNKKCPVY